MKELQVKTELPIINGNFEEVKASLEESLKKYEGIVVTEEGLQDCKKTQKDLSKVKKTIEDYRKGVKKELTQPITEFESKCKDLVHLVEKVEAPIKEGIVIFDEKRRQEKIDYAKEQLLFFLDENSIEEQYRKYDLFNRFKITLNTSNKNLKEQAENIVLEVKALQDLEKQRIKTTIDSVTMLINALNGDINKKLNIDDYVSKINAGATVEQLGKIINREHDLIFKTENPPVPPKEIVIEEKPKEIKTQEEVKTVIKEDETIKSEKLMFCTLKLKGTIEQMKILNKLIEENGIEYETVDKGWA